MGLTHSQYDAIMRVYDRRRISNHHIEEEHRRIAYKAIPELQELDRAVAHCAADRVRSLLTPMEMHAAGGAAVPFRDLLKKLAGGEDPAQKRRRLLAEHSFPEDYLDPVYTCSKCQDTGSVNGKRCTCFEREVVRLFYTQSGLASVLEKANFSTFDMSLYSEEYRHPRSGKSSRQIMDSAAASCRQFAENYRSGRLDNYLLLTGPTGVGKTFLTHCIAKELIDSGHSVIYYSAGELFDRLADARFSREQDKADSPVNDVYLSGCDLLIIDDLGTEMVNAFVVSALFQLLSSRITKGLGIVISTNLSIQDLSKIYSERISSRILERFTLIEVFGKDNRVQKRLRG